MKSNNLLIIGSLLVIQVIFSLLNILLKHFNILIMNILVWITLTQALVGKVQISALMKIGKIGYSYI